MNIQLNKHIASVFLPVVYNAINFKVDKIIMKGGRASFKSATAVIIILIGVLVNNCSALCIVKTDKSSKDKISNNFIKFMRILGIEHRFKYVSTNQRFKILDEDGNETGQVIRILGALNTDDIKSMTTDTTEGYGYTFVEEASLFRTENDVDSIFSTAMRGDGKHCFIMVYNPPMDPSNFLNNLYGGKECGIDLGYEKAYCYDIEHVSKEIAEAIGKDTSIVMIHHSTYLDILRCGMGKLISSNIVEYERQRKHNFRAWQWDKLGMIVGSDANVFWNIHEWKYNENISKEVKSVLFKYGLDCSNGGSDPWFAIKLLWVPNTRDLYILDEREVVGKADVVLDKYREVANKIREINPLNELCFGDSAVKYNVDGIRNQGINIAYAKEGMRYSKQRSVMWFQGLNHIYIDKYRTPLAWNQFTNYHHKIDKDGNITNELQDGNDHAVDSAFYGMVQVIQYD